MSFIYVGRLDELKGIKVLFQAWNLIGENAPLLKVCGTGPLENWCREFISENGIKSIKMLGFVPNTEAKKLIAYSQAMILPTQWYEGFPMTILEAFSVGTPVVCSDLGNAGAVVEESITGWKFKADSPAELVNAIERVTDIRDSVKRVYNENYTSEANYSELIEIYKEVSA